MRLRDPRSFEKPSFMIIPMIDIIFFLLVFFMMTSLSMVDLHSLGVQLPFAQAAQQEPQAQFVVTIKKDGSLWLNGKVIEKGELLASAKDQQAGNSNFSVVLCADRDIDYGQVADVLDSFKKAGITHLGLAAEKRDEP
ncbi:biopolymer transporter ExbD [Megasphaera elsdenii]|uniref:ExbD/TolR family protein n=1 Tax=Megasphaera TaxID=906 RepID=UPI001D02CA21|nr:biopolymer transporter ExbD [Megasphaera elsdenii]MCB5703081.1 biopolymer transporter ExbD [Megasphaera elsdenii]MCB5727336.1 biopolymer transporter ExbD [Megasphaera elsdenii]MCB5771116.1 biopolymer transporter ExbD [Megasphaera elsdenii]